ncbi:hypothetical protein QQF64_034052 [Cirrhinus molitorella]|uniref:Uncharacterized protein n=1 Tax=Cirrhinus molitorella TaxID=172907 RepID=A0ABR3MVM7_9TELE
MVTPTATSASTGAGKGRTYTFNVSWLKIFPWLEFENNLNLCKYCRGQNQAGNSSFVSGNTHLKSDSITKHNVSQQHIQCRDLYLRKEKSSGTVSAVLLSEEEKRRQLKIKMNIAYFIAKDEEPFVKFGPLIRLHRKNRVDINPTYNNDVRCVEMISQIADIMRDSLSAKLKAAKCLAVLIDGDIDISNTECEIVYVRLLENGKPVNLLVGQQTLEHSHAIGVLNATKAAFCAICPEEDGGSWMKKCISFGVEGASVNMGRCGGARAGNTDNSPLVSVVYDLLHLIWKTYHFSGKSKRELYSLDELGGIFAHYLASLKVPESPQSFLQHRPCPDQRPLLSCSQHMEHLAVAPNHSQSSGAGKKSLTLQRNDLVLPQATSEDSDQTGRTKGRRHAGEDTTMLAQQKSDGRRFQGITLKGNLKGFTDLTNPQLKQHMEAAINICVGELKARGFGDLLKDEGTQSPIESFRDLNP